VVDGLYLPRTCDGWTGSTQDIVVDGLVLHRTWLLMNWFYPGHGGGWTGSTQDMVVDGLVLPRTWWRMDRFYPGHGG